MADAIGIKEIAIFHFMTADHTETIMRLFAKIEGKKSKVLFGLSYSRARIAKQSRAIVVEGQVDCLRLIQAGFDYAVAGQGTAFGEEHVRELLQLGVKQVHLALDADTAGKEASV